MCICECHLHCSNAQNDHFHHCAPSQMILQVVFNVSLETASNSPCGDFTATGIVLDFFPGLMPDFFCLMHSAQLLV